MHDAQITLEKSENITVLTIDGIRVYVGLRGNDVIVSLTGNGISNQDDFQFRFNGEQLKYRNVKSKPIQEVDNIF